MKNIRSATHYVTYTSSSPILDLNLRFRKQNSVIIEGI